MSAHEVLVVKIEEILEHDNATSLDVIRVSGYSYSIISRKGDFRIGDLGIFIEPDYVVNTDLPEFSFLFGGKRQFERITTKRLRGIWSEGLLIKAKPEHVLGQNVIEEYGITRWEPPTSHGFSWGGEGSNLKGGLNAPEPNIPEIDNIPKYDLENIRKYSKVIQPDEEVFYTVKIHGSNARFVYWDGEMHCGSRTTWKKKPGEIVEFTNTRTGEVFQKETLESSWWAALDQNPWLKEWCILHPGLIIYGEVFGCFRYKTPILLSNKTSDMIGHIVNNKLNVEVMTLNLETKQLEPKKVINWFKYNITDANNFIKIKYARRHWGGRDTTITVTKNHKLFDDNLNEKSAGEFKIGDELCFISDHNLNYLQEQMILGSLLGDGHLSRGHTFQSGHCDAQKELTEIKHKILGNLSKRIIIRPARTHKIKGKETVSSIQHKIVSSSLHDKSDLDFRSFCYSSDNKKTITKEWLEKLTPIALAFWYMDDGSLIKSPGKNNHSILCTNSFDLTQQGLVIDFFKKLNIICYLNKISKTIAFSPSDTKKFQFLVSPYILPSLRYKLNEEFQNIPCILDSLIESSNRLSVGFVKTKIIKISSLNEFDKEHLGSYMYDIQVEGNSNYFANKVLVHNSIVQGNKFHYGYKDGTLGVRVFDVLNFGNWTSFKELLENPEYSGLKLVPVVYHGLHDPKILEEIAEHSETALDNCGEGHIREGIVIKLAKERFDYKLGRVVLKFVSRNYLVKS